MWEAANDSEGTAASQKEREEGGTFVGTGDTFLGGKAAWARVSKPSETLVFYHITASCHNAGDRDMHLQRRKNLQSCNRNQSCPCA